MTLHYQVFLKSHVFSYTIDIQLIITYFLFKQLFHYSFLSLSLDFLYLKYCDYNIYLSPFICEFYCIR